MGKAKREIHPPIGSCLLSDEMVRSSGQERAINLLIRDTDEKLSRIGPRTRHRIDTYAVLDASKIKDEFVQSNRLFSEMMLDCEQHLTVASNRTHQPTTSRASGDIMQDAKNDIICVQLSKMLRVCLQGADDAQKEALTEKVHTWYKSMQGRGAVTYVVNTREEQVVTPVAGQRPDPLDETGKPVPRKKPYKFSDENLKEDLALESPRHKLPPTVVEPQRPALLDRERTSRPLSAGVVPRGFSRDSTGRVRATFDTSAQPETYRPWTSDTSKHMPGVGPSSPDRARSARSSRGGDRSRAATARAGGSRPRPDSASSDYYRSAQFRMQQRQGVDGEHVRASSYYYIENYKTRNVKATHDLRVARREREAEAEAEAARLEDERRMRELIDEKRRQAGGTPRATPRAGDSSARSGNDDLEVSALTDEETATPRGGSSKAGDSVPATPRSEAPGGDADAEGGETAADKDDAAAAARTTTADGQDAAAAAASAADAVQPGVPPTAAAIAPPTRPSPRVVAPPEVLDEMEHRWTTNRHRDRDRRHEDAGVKEVIGMWSMHRTRLEEEIQRRQESYRHGIRVDQIRSRAVTPRTVTAYAPEDFLSTDSEYSEDENEPPVIAVRATNVDDGMDGEPDAPRPAGTWYDDENYESPDSADEDDVRAQLEAKVLAPHPDDDLASTLPSRSGSSNSDFIFLSPYNDGNRPVAAVHKMSTTASFSRASSRRPSSQNVGALWRSQTSSFLGATSTSSASLSRSLTARPQTQGGRRANSRTPLGHVFSLRKAGGGELPDTLQLSRPGTAPASQMRGNKPPLIPIAPQEPVPQTARSESSLRRLQRGEMEQIETAFTARKIKCPTAALERALLIPEDKTESECLARLPLANAGLIANPMKVGKGKKKKRKGKGKGKGKKKKSLKKKKA